MGIKLSRADALADAIASVRMEGLLVTSEFHALFDEYASGRITTLEVKAAILRTVAERLEKSSDRVLLS